MKPNFFKMVNSIILSILIFFSPVTNVIINAEGNDFGGRLAYGIYKSQYTICEIRTDQNGTDYIMIQDGEHTFWGDIILEENSYIARSDEGSVIRIMPDQYGFTTWVLESGSDCSEYFTASYTMISPIDDSFY